MINDRTNPPDLEHLFSAACDESLTDEERKSLDSALAADTQTQDAYLAFCRLHADIRMHVQSRRSIESALVAVIQREEKPVAVGSQPVGHAPRDENDPTDSARGACPTRSKSLLDRAAKRPTWPSLAITLLIMISVVGWMAVTYFPERVAESGVNKSNDELQESKKPEFVAWLMKAHETQWLDGTEPQKTKFMPGQRLAIAKGLIEIQYRTRAVVVIEGPAEFYVGRKGKSGNGKAESGQVKDSRRKPMDREQEANSGYLAHGKLVARVEGKDAKGFTIDTPTGAVEDFGTEFGVYVDGRTGATLAHVLEGEVRLHDNDGNSQVLVAGEAARVFENKIATVTVDPVLQTSWPTDSHEYDSANDPAYADGWQQGDNGGAGFGPWRIHTKETNGCRAFVHAGFADTFRVGRAWALTVGNRQFMSAGRMLSKPLGVGDNLSLKLGHGSLGGGSMSVWLADAKGHKMERVVIWHSIPRYQIGGGANNQLQSIPLERDRHGVHIRVTQLSDRTYRLELAPLSGGETVSVNRELAQPGVIGGVFIDVWNLNSRKDNHHVVRINHLRATRASRTEF